MTPSIYQTAIFDFIKNGQGNAVVEAVAGSGKTSTIVRSLDILPQVPYTVGSLTLHRDPTALFVAFNSHIAAELKSRVPSHVQASTLNSVGWGICRQSVRGVEMDIKKTENMLRTIYGTTHNNERKIFYRVKNSVCKMVSLAKALMLDGDQLLAQFNEIADKYDVEIPELKDAPEFDFADTVFKVFMKSVEVNWYMDFDDQIFMPVHYNWDFPSFDWVFGDEAQDWSPVQIELVRRLGASGRIVAVGDRHQSIYGFRGADPDAIPNIIRSLGAIVLPLSICYRCPDLVIAEAQQIVEHIESPDNNPKGKGIVETIKTEVFEDMLLDGDVVLCRTTAPLVKRCLGQIRRGRKATVKGKDIGKGLVTLLMNLAGNGLMKTSDFLEVLAQYRAEQTVKLNKAGREQESSNVEDRCDTLEVLALECNTVAQVERKIDLIFSDDAKGGILFMSGHRSKGLEADRIFFLRPDLCPHPKSVKDWQIIQESNLRYVIITRAMKAFYYVIKEKEER